MGESIKLARDENGFLRALPQATCQSHHLIASPPRCFCHGKRSIEIIVEARVILLHALAAQPSDAGFLQA